jgi:hypothetical protein
MLGSANNQATAKGGAMDSILQSDAIGTLPVNELSAAPEVFFEPVLMHLPEKRLQDVGKLIV